MLFLVAFHRWLSNAFSIFATASGIYPEVFAWSGIIILPYMSDYAELKKEEINI